MPNVIQIPSCFYEFEVENWFINLHWVLGVPIQEVHSICNFLVACHFTVSRSSESNQYEGLNHINTPTLPLQRLVPRQIKLIASSSFCFNFLPPKQLEICFWSTPREYDLKSLRTGRLPPSTLHLICISSSPKSPPQVDIQTDGSIPLC